MISWVNQVTNLETFDKYKKSGVF